MKASKLILLYILILLISCDSNESMYNVFKYNLPNQPTSLDPAFAKSLSNIWVCDHLFNTLVSLDENGMIVPEVADAWEISEDGLMYTFTLSRAYEFHEHECFTDHIQRGVDAHDVAYSLSRIIDKNINSPGSWIFKDRLTNENPFKVIDKYTLQINLASPFQPFLSLLSMQYCSIVPKEVVECLNQEFKNSPIGSDIFILKKWIKNQNIFLNVNPAYPDPEHNLEGIKISFIQDRKIAFLEMLNGNIDYFSGVESSFINQMLEKDGAIKKEHADKVKLIKSPYLNTEYIGFNLSHFDAKHPIQQAQFRRALDLAIDKKSLVRILRNDIGTPAYNGFAPPRLYADSINIPTREGHNLTKARSIIDEFDISRLPPFVINTNADYQDIMLFIAKQWEQLGLEVRVNLLESSVLREGMRNGNIGIFRASWIGDYADIENFMSLFYGKNDAPPNYSRFSSAKFDEFYDHVNVETDLILRENIISKMEDIIIDQAPVIPLFYDQTSNFYSTKITGHSNNLMNVPNLNRIQKKLN